MDKLQLITEIVEDERIVRYHNARWLLDQLDQARQWAKARKALLRKQKQFFDEYEKEVQHTLRHYLQERDKAQATNTALRDENSRLQKLIEVYSRAYNENDNLRDALRGLVDELDRVYVSQSVYVEVIKHTSAYHEAQALLGQGDEG
jgi:cell shape-determining protein MreC